MAKDKKTPEEKLEAEAVEIALELLQSALRINTLKVLSVLRHRHKGLENTEPSVIWRILVNSPLLKYHLPTGSFYLPAEEAIEFN